jgi:homoserine dehydrogenase
MCVRAAARLRAAGSGARLVRPETSMSTCVAAPSIDVALLGCGTVGDAFARLASKRSPPIPVNIIGALVRDLSRPRTLPASRVVSDARALLASDPGVVVELLGGTEPARTLILDALRRRIPVVTANKSVLARHGGELRSAAAQSGTPVLYEAAVIAGVPFLGAFARRNRARAISSLSGILNGTSNYILTRCADGWTQTQSLAHAQQRGYAEPDPHNDVAGIDAAEKLSVLLQHFAGRDVHPDSIETDALASITTHVEDARVLGGVVKPVVAADWARRLEAFVGPAFVPDTHVLSRVDGIENAIILNGPHGRLLFQGPGAGPDVTAATVLDDVQEIANGIASPISVVLKTDRPVGPLTSWLVSLDAPRLPRFADVADLLASHNIFARNVRDRTTRDGRDHQAFLVFPVERLRLDEGLRALRRAAGCIASAIRALEVTT